MGLLEPLGNPGSEYDRMRSRAHEVPGAVERIEEMWTCYEPHADIDFMSQFVEHPKERYWEMLLTVVLDDCFELIPTKAGPDVCINASPRPIWIEAVTPSRGSGDDEVPLFPEGGGLITYPEPQIILRLRSALKSKLDVYHRYVENGRLDPTDPYVVAISAGRLYETLMDPRAAILKAVLPIGFPQLLINRDTGEAVDGGYSYRPHVSKAGGASVSTTCFLDSEYSGISGVLLSEANFLLDKSAARDEFFFVHNPMAKNPLPSGWLGFGLECMPVLQGDGLIAETHRVGSTRPG